MARSNQPTFLHLKAKDINYGHQHLIQQKRNQSKAMEWKQVRKGIISKKSKTSKVQFVRLTKGISLLAREKGSTVGNAGINKRIKIGKGRIQNPLYYYRQIAHRKTRSYIDKLWISTTLCCKIINYGPQFPTFEFPYYS